MKPLIYRGYALTNIEGIIYIEGIGACSTIRRAKRVIDKLTDGTLK